MADRHNDPIDAITVDNVDYGDRISQYFKASDLIRSTTASRNGIDNTFRLDKELQSAIYLARTILDPLAAKFGPFIPESIFRCQNLERALKHKPSLWVSGSQHTKGEAADIEVHGLTTLQLATWIKDTLPFDQLILECYTPGVPQSGWVHVSSLQDTIKNRKECLTFDGKKYTIGFNV